VLFFIILVGNVGGALSPLGDPPLFVGFLRGVDFFWTTQNLWLQTIIVSGCLLALFAAIDLWRFRAEPKANAPSSYRPIRVHGLANLPLIAAIIASILASALWKPGIALHVLGAKLELQNLLRDASLLAIAGLSLWLTPDEHREANGFTWEPIREVAKLFAAIFTAIIPVVAMLAAGRHGAFDWLLSAVTEPRGRPPRGALFLVHRVDVGFSRQCADLPVVLRTRRRRSAAADGRAVWHACRDLDGRGLHGCAHLYRKRAQLHGGGDRQRGRDPDAEFLRLSVARRCGSDPVVSADHVASRRPGSQPQLDRVSSFSMGIAA
jgi:hypothetical protein